MNSATLPPALALLPLLAACGWAAAVDARTRRIPNVISLPLAAAGIAYAVTGGAVVGPGGAALGLLAGFGLLVVPYAIGAMGGGDVKLLAAVGAWVGPAGALGVFVVATLFAAVLALCQATASGRLGRLLGNSALLAVNVAHVRSLGVDHLAGTGRSLDSAGRPLPYAVPVLVGVAAVVAAM